MGRALRDQAMPKIVSTYLEPMYLRRVGNDKGDDDSCRTANRVIVRGC